MELSSDKVSKVIEQKKKKGKKKGMTLSGPALLLSDDDKVKLATENIHATIVKHFKLTSMDRTAVGKTAILKQSLLDTEFQDIVIAASLEELAKSDKSPSEDDRMGTINLAKEETKKTNAITYNGKMYFKNHVMKDTLIHECIHFYCEDVFQNKLCASASKGINEGVTEYFARKIMSQLDVKESRSAYSNEVKVAEQLANCLGEQVLIDAYFFGNIDQFKDNYLKTFGVKWEDDLHVVQLHCKDGKTILTYEERKKANEERKKEDEENDDSLDIEELLNRSNNVK